MWVVFTAGANPRRKRWINKASRCVWGKPTLSGTVAHSSMAHSRYALSLSLLIRTVRKKTLFASPNADIKHQCVWISARSTTEALHVSWAHWCSLLKGQVSDTTDTSSGPNSKIRSAVNKLNEVWALAENTGINAQATSLWTETNGYVRAWRVKWS